MINGQSIETAQVKCLGHRKQTRHLVEKDRQESSPGTPLGVTRGQTTCKTGQAFPWHPSRGNQETDYMQDETSLPLAPLFWKPGDRLHTGRNKPSPGTPLWGTRRQTTSRTGQAFPWHPSQGNQGTDYMEDKEAFPWHPSWGNQETDYMEDETSLPLAPLLGKPGDRLHAGQRSTTGDP